MKKITLLFIAGMTMLSTFAANVQLVVSLKNGDVVTGAATLPKMTIQTPYGTLSVPIEKINSIKLGLVSDHTKDGAVLPDLNKLQTVSENEAKGIYERLLGYGTPILSTIVNFTQNPFYKISDNEKYTIEQLIDELYKKADLTSDAALNDAITYDGSNYVEGALTFGDITLQTEYGTLNLKRNKITSMEVSFLDEPTSISADGNYKLKANYHISGNDNDKGWVNTGVKVKSGDKFTITASGKIVLKSLSGGVYSPNGYVSGIKDGAYTDDAELRYGTVVYKIGTEGEMIAAGSQYEGIADNDGYIYISIYETVYDKANSGSYTVKVLKK